MARDRDPIKHDIAQHIRLKEAELCRWYSDHSRSAPPPLYSSVDIRDASFKIAPVDCNLFPAGFNNICSKDLRGAPEIFRRNLKQNARRAGIEVHKVLVLPESHTTNQFYLESLSRIQEILLNAGFEVRVGWLEQTSDSIRLESRSGKQIEAFPVTVSNKRMQANGFDPDVVILNNDFSSGYPSFLDEIAQPIWPSHALGWHRRKKSEHFRHYHSLIDEFSKILGLDPWIFQVDTDVVENVNFGDGSGVDLVADKVEASLERIRSQYTKRKIKQEPFVFVKNNAGTYGIGVMVVRSRKDILEMNRRDKNKMSVGKGKSAIQSVVIQEGVPTMLTYKDRPAEPVVYLCSNDLVGGFLRFNLERSSEENLNARGMEFESLCMSELDQALQKPDITGPFSLFPRARRPDENVSCVLESVYGCIARVSALAAGKELSQFSK